MGGGGCPVRTSCVLLTDPVSRPRLLHFTGYPLHRENRENRENGQKNPCHGKQGIWKFCQNTGKTQGILFAQVVISLRVKDIAIFATGIRKKN